METSEASDRASAQRAAFWRGWQIGLFGVACLAFCLFLAYRNAARMEIWPLVVAGLALAFGYRAGVQARKHQVPDATRSESQSGDPLR